MVKTAIDSITRGRRPGRFSVVAALLLAASACSAQHDAPAVAAQPAAAAAAGAESAGKTPAEPALRSQTGLASWYGKSFDGKPTASGRIFDSDEPLAAHPDWPFGTRVKVINMDNRREHEVLIVDRGPAAPQRNKGVVIDLSRSAAEKLRFVDQGVTEVRLEVLGWGEPEDAD